MKSAEELVSFSQGNFEAMMKAGQIWAAGVQDLQKQFAATALVPGQVRIIMKMDPQTALPASTLTHIRVRAVTVGAVTGLAITAQMAEEEVTSHPLKIYPAGF